MGSEKLETKSVGNSSMPFDFEGKKGEREWWLEGHLEQGRMFLVGRNP